MNHQPHISNSKMLTVGPILQTLRLSTLISLSLNAAVAVLGGVLLGSMPGRCGRSELVSPASAAASSIAKVVCMIGAGVAQGAVASTIARRSIGAPFDPDRDFHLVARVISQASNASRLSSFYFSLSLARLISGSGSVWLPGNWGCDSAFPCFACGSTV